jgi:hypothetical protein
LADPLSTFERIVTLVGAVGGLTVWFPLVRRVVRWVVQACRAAPRAARRAYRMRRLRGGKYVANLSIAEFQDAAERPGIDALHPQVRAEVEKALRDAVNEAGKWRLPDLGRFG